MSKIIKLEFRNLLIDFGKSLFVFIALVSVSIYLLINYWELWPVFLILSLWIGVMDRPIKILKLPQTELNKVWGDKYELRRTRVLLRFFSSLIHSLFLVFLTVISIKLYIIFKPELSITLANQISPSAQKLALIYLFLIGLLFATLAMVVSICGDIKKLNPNTKSIIFTIIFVGLEIILMRLNLYYNLLLNIIVIIICLILSILWVERITINNEK